MYLLKRPDGSYSPYDDSDYQESQKIPIGDVIKASKARNYEFLKKFMALVRLGYDNWNPPLEETKWGIPVKSFTRFRKDMTIKAGHYELVVDIKGEAKVEAESLTFESMGAEKFEQVYADVREEIANLIGLKSEEIDKQLMGFY